MKRQNEKTEQIMFKKNGGGTFRLSSGKIVKPNEKFKARMEEIPVAFKDQIIPLDTPKDEVEEPAVTPIYEKQDAKLFYIVDGSGESVNDKRYNEEQANAILEDGLQKEEKSAGWCNLIDPFGWYFNIKSLRQDDADELIKRELDKQHAPLFNVVDGQGKIVNEVPLEEQDADQLIKDLS